MLLTVMMKTCHYLLFCKKMKKKVSDDQTHCKQCKFQYGDQHDPQKNAGWIKCSAEGCDAWLHETCAELYGVFDDAVYVCRECL